MKHPVANLAPSASANSNITILCEIPILNSVWKYIPKYIYQVFIIASCGICQSVGVSSRKGEQWPVKPNRGAHKNKACAIGTILT